MLAAVPVILFCLIMSSNPFFMVIFNFLGILKSKTMPVNLWTSPRVIFSSSDSDSSQVIIYSAIAVSLHVVNKSSTYTPIIVLCTCLSACRLLNIHGSYGFCTYPFFINFSLIVSCHNFPDSIRPYRRALRHSAVSLLALVVEVLLELWVNFY